MQPSARFIAFALVTFAFFASDVGVCRGDVQAVSVARASTVPDTDEQRIEDLVTANHILADQGVLDAYGHVSVRSVNNPKHFFLAWARAPELTQSQVPIVLSPGNLGRLLATGEGEVSAREVFLWNDRVNPDQRKTRRNVSRWRYHCGAHQLFDDVRCELMPFDAEPLVELARNVRLDHCSTRGWRRQRDADLDETVKAQIAIRFHQSPT
jgi:hypothetical protein